MSFRNLFALVSVMAALTITASSVQGQDSVRTISLNEFVMKSGTARAFKSQTRVSNVTVAFEPGAAAASKWGSSFLLTSFPSPTSQPFTLISVDGRLADYDTTQLGMDLVVMQFTADDTVLYKIPVDGVQRIKGKKGAYRVSLRGRGVRLQPSSFYLGYGFRPKNLVNRYECKLYSTEGGEGATVKRTSAGWNVYSNPAIPYVFPFTMSFWEN